MSMRTFTAATSVAGYEVGPLDEAVCDGYLAWLLGEQGAAPPSHATDLAWMLAHSDDGVTWGRCDQDAKTWILGHETAPEVSPPVRRETLQELRLFGDSAEVLIWRGEEGWRGRVLRDTEPPTDRSDESNPLRPSDEHRILRGDHVVATCERGFTRVSDRTGAEQVLPIVVSRNGLQARRARIHVRHYWEQDVVNGAVRIAATRLVKLTGEEADGA